MDNTNNDNEKKSEKRRKSSCYIPSKTFSVSPVDAPIDDQTSKAEEDFVNVLNNILLNDKTMYIRHIEQVKKEKHDLRKEYLRIKSLYEIPKKNPPWKKTHIKWSDCKDDINAEDKEFLSAKPDYTKIGLKMDQLSEQIAALSSAKYSSRKLMQNKLQLPKHKVDNLKRSIGLYLQNCKEFDNNDDSNTTDDSDCRSLVDVLEKFD